MIPDQAPFARAYREIRQTLHGPKAGPADTAGLAALQALSDRLEPGLMAVNTDVAVASIAISLCRGAEALCRIADSLEKCYIAPEPVPEPPFMPELVARLKRAGETGEWS